MLKKFMLLAGLAVLPSALAASEKVSPAATQFGTREAIQHVNLSPDGTRLVYLMPGPGATTVAYVQTLDGAPKPILRSSGSPDRLRWCEFVSNDRLICQISLMMTSDGLLMPFSRMLSLDADGGNIRQLGERDSGKEARLRQFDAGVLDWLPGQDGVILMVRDYVAEERRGDSRMGRQADGLGVDRIDVRSLKASRVEPVNAKASGFLTDGRGNVRIMMVPKVRSSGYLGRSTEFFYRTEGSRDWRELGEHDGSRQSILPVAIDATTNSAYVLKSLNGRDALYRVKLDGSMATELVFSHDKVDVDDVVREGRGERVIGVTFAEDKRHVVYFDKEYEELAKALGDAIPNLPLIDFVGSSADRQKLLVFAGSDADPGRYFLFDRKAQNLAELMLVRPQLEKVALAKVKAVTYPAADGTSIPGYLTLPPGGNGRNLPAVVLPHGGPSARDEWGFDWLAQFLANQGYAVLQPNYRGSAGFGDEWLQQNGFKSWRTSVGDITAGARWMAAQGIADPGRLAIVGWSYGGYAALQAGATDPDLFKAVVAIAPVTDLVDLRQDSEGYTNARNVAEFIGTGPHLTEGSPLQNAAAIRAPVMLFHGDRDLNVLVDHSRRMDRALRKEGKQSELVVFEGLEHDLADSQARGAMLGKIGGFLGQALAK